MCDRTVSDKIKQSLLPIPEQRRAVTLTDPWAPAGLPTVFKVVHVLLDCGVCRSTCLMGIRVCLLYESPLHYHPNRVSWESMIWSGFIATGCSIKPDKLILQYLQENSSRDGTTGVVPAPCGNRPLPYSERYPCHAVKTTGVTPRTFLEVIQRPDCGYDFDCQPGGLPSGIPDFGG